MSPNWGIIESVITFLTGENTYQVALAKRHIIEDFLKKHGQHSVEMVEGEEFNPQNFSGLLQGASLFAASRLVVIKDLSKNKPAWDELTNWLDKIPDETDLLLVDSQPDKRTKTFKSLKVVEGYKEFGLLSEEELIRWMQKFASQIGGRLDRAQAKMLIVKIGFDQWQLSSEIEKLVAFKSDISSDTIELLTDSSAEGSAFELLDASLGGDAKKMVYLVGQLKTQEDPYKLFGLLAAQVHSLAVAAAAGSKPADEIARDAGLHPFVVRKTQILAKRLGLKKVREIATQLAKCDDQLKSTAVDPWDLLSLALGKIASASR